MNFGEASKKVRGCKTKYLLYFAYTIVKKKPAGYKEDPKYQVFSQYEIVCSDSLDTIKEYRDQLLSLINENINSYVYVIIDRTNQKILKKIKKLVNINTITETYQIPNSQKYNLLYSCKDNTKKYKDKIYPYLHYNEDLKLSDLDFFFRGPSEVPEDYKWDEGEYVGWLQFRWGDGLNAIQKDEQKL
jgi:hypothetical protein